MRVVKIEPVEGLTEMQEGYRRGWNAALEAINRQRFYVNQRSEQEAAGYEQEQACADPCTIREHYELKA